MLIERISSDLKINRDILDYALKMARIQVKTFPIDKKNGKRIISQPSSRLKLIHYWLIENIFKKMPVHETAMAFQESLDIRKNAIKHKRNKYFLKLDFKDFFPSLKFSDLIPYLDKWCQQNNGYNGKDEELYKAIETACFNKLNRLPIGYPSSPIISNIIMFDFDVYLIKELESKMEQFGKVVYTRYADDLIFSTNQRLVCKKVMKIIKEKLKSMDSPKLRINNSKTRFLSSSGGSAIVTGLRVCYDGHITIHRKYKNRIRGLLHKFEINQLSEPGISTLRGHLSYIKYADPVYYTKLNSFCYGSINKILSM